jgi:UDP-N-acetylglucosamine--N-acetylmuramyl-(pentapeptide) pyrophosphoryl-undecaprenol N-acetylglucosamine transferase
MRVLVVAGITGGHIYPGIAIANEIRLKNKDAVIEFVGVEGCLEDRVVPLEGYKVNHIKAAGFEKYSLKLKVKAFFEIFTGLSDAIKIINEFKPDVVIGMGSFITASMVWASWLKKVPSIVHEQNAYPGRAIKAVAPFTNKIAISFESSKKYFSKRLQNKIILTGNPVRKEFEAYSKEVSRKTLKLKNDEKIILCLGGSLGAKKINNAAIELARKLQNYKNIKIIIITGKRQYDEVERNVDLNIYKNIELLAYADNMPILLNVCDLVICRGGATTLFENMITATPGIYIPYPYASADHQRENINYITSQGGGFMIEDNQLNGDSLYDKVSKIIFDDKNLQQMSVNAMNAAPQNVLEKFYSEIMKII